MTMLLMPYRETVNYYCDGSTKYINTLCERRVMFISKQPVTTPILPEITPVGVCVLSDEGPLDRASVEVNT